MPEETKTSGETSNETTELDDEVFAGLEALDNERAAETEKAAQEDADPIAKRIKEMNAGFTQNSQEVGRQARAMTEALSKLPEHLSSAIAETVAKAIDSRFAKLHPIFRADEDENQPDSGDNAESALTSAEQARLDSTKARIERIKAEKLMTEKLPLDDKFFRLAAVSDPRLGSGADPEGLVNAAYALQNEHYDQLRQAVEYGKKLGMTEYEKSIREKAKSRDTAVDKAVGKGAIIGDNGGTIKEPEDDLSIESFMNRTKARNIPFVLR